MRLRRNHPNAQSAAELRAALEHGLATPAQGRLALLEVVLNPV